jgi:sortase A
MKAATDRRKRWLRWVEWFFWAVAFVLIGAYAWVYIDRSVYQAYEEWSFDRTLNHEPAPVLGFLFHSIRFGSGASQSSQHGTPDDPSLTPQRPVLRRVMVDGSIIGRIEIPRIGVKAIVRESTDSKTLRRAVGHIEGTAFPGQLGNVGLAGHRDTFFRSLRDIRRGDTINLTTLDGEHLYEVQSIRVVEPTDTQVLQTSADRSLTLVTCYPFDYIGPAPKRFIVRATEITRSRPSLPGS